MKASVFLFGAGAAAREYRILSDAAALADKRVEFEGIWVPERHFGRLGGAFPNPAVLAASLARTTTRLRLRAGSLVLPLHDPIRAAEEWAAVDVLSDGRAEIALASGWLPDDFVLAPSNFATRKALLFEQAETLVRLWRGERIARTNGAGEDVEVGIGLRPLQSAIPMWLASSSGGETTLAAGRQGAGLLTHLLSQDLDQLAAAIAGYSDAWQGMVGAPRVAVMLHLFVARDDKDLIAGRRLLGRYLRESIALASPEAAREAPDDDVDALVEAGVDRLLDQRSLVCRATELEKRIDAFREAGVDELALLIDFGPDWSTIGRSLEAVADALSARRRLVQSRPLPGRPSVARVLDTLGLLERYPIAHLQATPTLLRLIVDDARAGRALGELDEIFVGGERLTGALARRLQETGATVHNVYGPTETTVWATSMRLDAWRPEVDVDPPIGRPLGGYSVYVLDDCLDVMPADVPGEIYIGGPALSVGYWGDPRRTAERFLPDPFGEPGARMYRTGDIGVYDDAGVLRYVGREDAQVKVRGHRVELQEVEQAISAVAGVRAAVVVVDDEGSLVACVETVEPPGTPHALTFGGGAAIIDGRYRVQGREHELRALCDEMFTFAEYERAIADLPPAPVVLDVGANIGMFAVLVHAHDPSARQVSVEPVPSTAERLRRTLHENGIASDVRECAAWDVPGRITMTVFPEAPGFSSAVHSAEHNVARAVEVARAAGPSGLPLEAEEDVRELARQRFDGYEVVCDALGLDELVAGCGHDRVDLLKLDVEGAELRVLEAADEATWRKVAAIVLEAESRADAERIAAHLKACGYAVEARPAAMPNLRAAGVQILYARRPDARVEPVARATDLESEVLRAVGRQLPDYMVPDRVVTVSTIPTTANGKVDRSAVGSLVARAASPVPRERPVDPPEPAADDGSRVGTLEDAVRQAWLQVLGRVVGDDRNFFDVGGNSLLMLRVQASLRRTTTKPPSLVALFEHPTIAALTAALYRDGAEIMRPDAGAER